MIVVADPAGFCQIFAELAVGDRSCLQAGISTGLIQRDRVKACEHSDIRQDRRVIFTVTVTVRADVLNQRDMEARTVVTDSLCIFCHLAMPEAR